MLEAENTDDKLGGTLNRNSNSARHVALGTWQLVIWQLAIWQLAIWQLAVWQLAMWQLAIWQLAIWQLARATQEYLI